MLPCLLDVATPPQCYHSSFDVSTSLILLLLFHQCCCSFFSITAPPSTLLLLLQCFHFTLMLPLLLNVAMPPRCCHASSMLPLLLNVAIPRCFHFSYFVVAFSAVLLLLLQYCCSSFNIVAPPSMLPLHLDVASPPSILTLHQCCCSFDGLMFLLIANIIAPPLLLLLFLECFNAPVKMNYFQLHVFPTGHYTRG